MFLFRSAPDPHYITLKFLITTTYHFTELQNWNLI